MDKISIKLRIWLRLYPYFFVKKLKQHIDNMIQNDYTVYIVKMTLINNNKTSKYRNIKLRRI